MNSLSFHVETEPDRQRVLSAMLNLTRDTALEPSSYEQMLLGQFVHGDLTIDQVLDLLDAS
jgi:hypothetical protein